MAEDAFPLDEFGHEFENICAAVSRSLRGQEAVVRAAVTCLVANGHLLIEGPPGLGKTLLARTLAASIAGTSARVQFTPDLMPADLHGFRVWNPSEESGFEFRPGPVFNNIVLADEINRASPKAQSGLLEVMEERTVSLQGEQRKVPRPFFVIATQNPTEMVGTYRLPEAQVDRFAMKVTIGYPDPEVETDLVCDPPRWDDDDYGDIDLGGDYGDHRVSVHNGDGPEHRPEDVDVGWMIREARTVEIDPALGRYCVDLARATRDADETSLGVSTRGTQALAATCRVRARAQGRRHVELEDVRALVPAVFLHRIHLTPEARGRKRTARHVLAQAIEGVRVPRSPAARR